MFFKKKKNPFSEGNAMLVKDSEEWIEELNEEISKGNLTLDTYINIVRDEEIWMSDTESCYPIIDYYRLDEYETLSMPLESFEDQSQYSPEEWQEMLKEHEELLNQYLEDEPDFEKMKVSAMIEELNIIIRKLK